MYQIQMGRDDYDHADHLAGQLLKQAQSSGFSEYVPILSQIVNYLNRGQGKQAVPLVDKLMNQFKNQMATDKNQY